jgi:hypothetical protein
VGNIKTISDDASTALCEYGTCVYVCVYIYIERQCVSVCVYMSEVCVGNIKTMSDDASTALCEYCICVCVCVLCV